MRLVGANAGAAVAGADELPGKSNYFIGNDSKKWRRNVPNYAKVKYQNVYPGVDLVYYGNQSGQLEYDFVVAPGADLSVIALDVAAGLSRQPDGTAVPESPTVAAGLPRHRSSEDGGVKPPLQERAHRDAPLQIATNGDLVVEADGCEVRFHKPLVYQPAINNGQRTTDHGQPTPVEGDFVLQASNRVGFEVASYDHTRPLVIDPVLSYSTYLGGSSGYYPATHGYAIAVDSAGNAYVTGYTQSDNFPTVNPFQANYHGYGATGDAFVAKLNAAGSALVYSTYLGGNNLDVGYGIAVDSSGNAYVTGETGSTDFPTLNPIQAINHGLYGNAFVAKLNASGSALVYATYLGGSYSDIAYSIAVDSSENAYVTGQAASPDFPTANPLRATKSGYSDAFVAKLNAAGSALVYSTYLGGGSDNGYAIAVDPSGNAYVTGFTASADFPTVNPLQATSTGNGDAFVARIAQGTERPSVRVSPSSLTFAPQNLGTTRAAQVVTLSNTSGTALTISNTVAAGDFAQSNNCAGSLGAGAGCTISVTFTPTSIGTRTGAITIMDNAADSPQTVTLSGLGLRPVVCLPGSLSFPSTVEFTTSHSQTVTCTNTQSASVTFSSITTNLTDFGVTNSGTCSTLSPLLPGGHCTIVVSFSPSIVGLEEGTLTITDSANPQSVALSGRGVAPPRILPESLPSGR